MTATEALRQCIEAMKLVDFKDCGESPELWQKINAAQANAERVLREGEKQGVCIPRPVAETFELYKAVNEMMAHIGMVGRMESDHPTVDAVMNALWALDGDKVEKRVDELMEKAFMPCYAATKTAVNEYIAISQDAISAPTADIPYSSCKCNHIGECDGSCAPYIGPTPSLQADVEVPLTSIDDMCRILKSMLIEPSEYTDCTILYEVTFEQLRNLYMKGQSVAPQPPAAPSGDVEREKLAAALKKLIVAADNIEVPEGGLTGWDNLQVASEEASAALADAGVPVKGE